MHWATVYFFNRFEYVIGSYWFDIYRLHMFGLSVLDHAHESIYLKPILRLFGFLFLRPDTSVWVRLGLSIMREKNQSVPTTTGQAACLVLSSEAPDGL